MPKHAVHPGRRRSSGTSAGRLGIAARYALFALLVGMGGTGLGGVVLLGQRSLAPSPSERPGPPQAVPSVPRMTVHPRTMETRAPEKPRSPSPAPSRRPPAPAPVVFLSDLRIEMAFNGFGPIERDRSNGGHRVADGNPLSLDGTRFRKGIGVRAPSYIRFRLARPCARFNAVLGLDDEEDEERGPARPNLGLVRFIVRMDGRVLYRSPLVAPFDRARAVGVALPRGRVLELIVDPVGLSVDDHADWAGARLHCP